MASLAAQFRRLVAKDWPFGAEPPLPDVGLLRRIAERTLNRPVAVTIYDRTVILRAETEEPDVAGPKGEDAAEPAPPPADASTDDEADGAEHTAPKSALNGGRGPRGEATGHEDGPAEDTPDGCTAALTCETGPARKATGREMLAGNAANTKDLDRLLRQADVEMDEPAKRRRRSAMNHLKAAVAATEADPTGPDDLAKSDAETPQKAYRADLARVIRPRRPGGAIARD